jgi:hypothetical protein
MSTRPASVRRTVDLDDDLVALIRQTMRNQGRTMKAVINDAIRRGITSGRVESSTRQDASGDPNAMPADSRQE